MSEIANIILTVREIVDDNATSKFVRQEDLTKQVATGNTKFYVDNGPIASMDVALVDGVVIPSTAYTLDTAKGLITFTVAPATSVFLTYYWYDFTDTQITDFAYRGLSQCGLSTGKGNEETDLSVSPEALKTAVSEYSAHYAYSSLASKMARLFKASAGKKEIDKDNIYNKYKEGAKEYWDKAELTKDNYYKRQGRREAPAFAEAAVNYPSNQPPR